MSDPLVGKERWPGSRPSVTESARSFAATLSSSRTIALSALSDDRLTTRARTPATSATSRSNEF
jgi:hypothetical protein